MEIVHDLKQITNTTLNLYIYNLFSENKRKNLKRKNTATSASGVFNTDNFVVVLGCLIVFYFKI